MHLELLLRSGGEAGFLPPLTFVISLAAGRAGAALPSNAIIRRHGGGMIRRIVFLLIVIFLSFAIGWRGRARWDKDIIVVEKDPHPNSTYPPGNMPVIYRGIDNKMHWGVTKEPYRPEWTKDDPRSPKVP
jgi:hypothetical protein